MAGAGIWGDESLLVPCGFAVVSDVPLA